MKDDFAEFTRGFELQTKAADILVSRLDEIKLAAILRAESEFIKYRSIEEKLSNVPKVYQEEKVQQALESASKIFEPCLQVARKIEAECQKNKEVAIAKREQEMTLQLKDFKTNQDSLAEMSAEIKTLTSEKNKIHKDLIEERNRNVKAEAEIKAQMLKQQ